MASVTKFTAGAVYNQLRHNLRQIAHSGNPDIDPARLRQDYVLSPDRGMSDYDYFQERLSQLYVYKTYHIKEVVAPTCTSEGYTIYECNEVPGLTYKGEYTAKLPHSWDGGVVTKAATIYAKGVKTFTCTVCGETRTEDIQVLDKTWHKGQTVAPTCTEQGYTIYICDQDKNLTEKRDYTAALGHDYDNGVVTTPATCTTEGVLTYTCTRDGATKTETIPALGHKWDDGKITTAPTCETEGEKTYKYEQDIFEKTNSLRVNSGLSELTYRSDLQFAADIRVEEILQNYIIYGSIDGKWGAHTRPDHSSAGTALGDKSDLACGENAAMESCIFDEEHLYYLWYNSKGHRDAMLNPNANGMACAVREYNGLVFGIQIFVNDPNYTASTQSAASDTSTPVEIAAVVVADSATTETAAN